MEANGAGPAERQVEIPITEHITLTNVHLELAPNPDGGRLLQIYDPLRSRCFSIGLTPEISRALGQALLTTLEVAGPGDVPRPPG